MLSVAASPFATTTESSRKRPVTASEDEEEADYRNNNIDGVSSTGSSASASKKKAVISRAPMMKKARIVSLQDLTEKPATRALQELKQADLSSPKSVALQTIAKTLAGIEKSFPKALTNQDLVSKVTQALSVHGFKGYGSSTLLCTSLCCDEISRPLEDDFQAAYGPLYFSMGGLAGFPFGGVTSFAAMAAHIPDGGHGVVLYGPHVGVDSTGLVGSVERRGRRAGGACCGSACAAAAYCHAVHEEGAEELPVPEDPLDAQQYFVNKMLLPSAKRLEDAKDKMAELPYAMFEEQDKMMQNIFQQACEGGALDCGSRIALIGGIQINTPEGMADYFLPLRMEVRNSINEVVADLID